MIPVVAERLKPEGNTPELMLHVYGAVPPLTVSCVLKAAPTVPDGGLPETVSMPGVAAEMLIVSCAVTVNGMALESTTLKIAVDVPTVVGVPEIAPVVPLKLNPGDQASTGESERQRRGAASSDQCR